ncbi:MAG: redox-regulated ATPase YchF [Candidatus Paceibacteria bacterium]
MLSIGIIGLPNAGKSSLFKALTYKKVPIEKYPFTTIQPHHGIVKVPDKTLEELAKITPGNEVLPAVIEFVDIAGLIKGAHKGEGLGNQFLAHIRETNAIVEVVRAFPDPTVPHPNGTPDPERDIKTIEEELIMADLQSVEHALEKWQKAAKSKEKGAEEIYLALKKSAGILGAGNSLKNKLSNEEMSHLSQFNLLTLKPLLLVLNVSENTKIESNEFVVLPLKLLAEISELGEVEAKTILLGLGFSENPLDQLVRRAFLLLDLVTFYTIKPPETRAWLVKKDTKLPEAGGIIHTDFKEKFIRAEVIPAKELIVIGSWHRAKELGKIRLEGRDSIVQDGDVIEFKI